MFQPGPAYSRRSVVFGASGLAIAAAAATAGGLSWADAPAPRQKAHISSPAIDGGYIRLGVPAKKFIREQTVHHNTVLQSFVFDDVARHIYVLQVMQDQVRLDGEAAPLSWDQRSADGDLCVSKIDFDGTVLEYMYCLGFGHGVSCGLERAGDDVFLWTEADAGPVAGHSDRYGFGRAIARFPFAHGQVLDFGASDFEVHRPQPGTTGNMPTVDSLNNRLLLRYFDTQSEPHWRYAVYDLQELRTGQYEPAHDIAQVGVQSGETFQGFALHGDYLYQMTGTMYNEDNPASEGGNCYVSSIDVRTGELVERFHNAAAHTLPFREPEGVAISKPAGKPARLFLGFADGVDDGRNISLYYMEHT